MIEALLLIPFSFQYRTYISYTQDTAAAIMAQQRVDDPSDPPPAYDSVVRPSNASGGQAPASAATTSAAPSERPSASTSQSTGVDAQGERRPRRGNSATEELDLEQEDRPLPPGWVPQYSEEHDSECVAWALEWRRLAIMHHIVPACSKHNE